MKSVYYDPATLQVQALLDSPILAPVRNWAALGYVQAVVPEGVALTRDHKVKLNAQGDVIGSTKNPHPVQVTLPREEVARISGLAKLYKIAGLTEEEIEAQEH
jgi:hypothetical protein